jgi:hypothetical protein
LDDTFGGKDNWLLVEILRHAKNAIRNASNIKIPNFTIFMQIWGLVWETRLHLNNLIAFFDLLF